jgi:hypothetical protein
MKQIYIITIISLLNLNFLNAQTVTIDDPTLGALATYTFTYVTTGAIGVGTATPNIIDLTKPSGYPNFVAINPLISFAPYAIVKVNGVTVPINTTNFGSIYGSWTSGIQISTGGATGGTTIPAGATIEIIVSNIITNPEEGGVHTFNWRTAAGSGAATENFSFNVDFSTLSTEDLTLNSKDITIFPNPSSDFLQISGLMKAEKYILYNTLGVKISNGIISDNEKMNIQNLTNGIYFLKFENGNTLKFLKK